MKPRIPKTSDKCQHAKQTEKKCAVCIADAKRLDALNNDGYHFAWETADLWSLPLRWRPNFRRTNGVHRRRWIQGWKSFIAGEWLLTSFQLTQPGLIHLNKQKKTQREKPDKRTGSICWKTMFSCQAKWFAKMTCIKQKQKNLESGLWTLLQLQWKILGQAFNFFYFRGVMLHSSHLTASPELGHI